MIQDTRIIEIAYKWLPLIMGCHCMPSRSFFVNGVQMPVCARCEGIIIGSILGIVLFPFFRISTVYYLPLIVPLIIDGLCQRITSYESNNWRRLLTGIVFGYATVSLVVLSWVIVFNWGYQQGGKIHARLIGNCW